MPAPKFFMDYVAKTTSNSSGWKGLGCQMLDELPEGRRPFSEGMEDFVLTEPVELHKGANLITVKASKEKPVTGYTIIFPMAKPSTFIHPMDRK